MNGALQKASGKVIKNRPSMNTYRVCHCPADGEHQPEKQDGDTICTTLCSPRLPVPQFSLVRDYIVKSRTSPFTSVSSQSMSCLQRTLIHPDPSPEQIVLDLSWLPKSRWHSCKVDLQKLRWMDQYYIICMGPGRCNSDT